MVYTRKRPQKFCSLEHGEKVLEHRELLVGSGEITIYTAYIKLHEKVYMK